MKSESRRFINNIGSRFLILAFAVLIFLGGISFKQARKVLIESTFEKLKIVTTIKEDEIKLWFRQEKASFLLISQFAEVSNYTEILLDKDSSNKEKVQAERQLSDCLKHILEFKNNWNNISILALNGEVILGTDSSLEGKIIPIDKLNYYDVSTTRDRINPIFYQSEFTGKPTVTLGIPLFNSAKKQIALVTTNLNLRQLAPIVGKQTGLGATEKIYLVSLLQGNPTLISQDSQASDSNFNSWLLKNINPKNNSQKIYYNSQKQPILGIYQSLNDQNIVLIAQIHQAEALILAHKLARTITLFAIASMGIIYGVIRHFTKELKCSRWQQEKQQKQLEQEVIEKRKIAQALARSNAILSAQQKTSIDGILIIDKRQHIVTYNQRFIDLWQIQQSFPIGSSGESLLAYLKAQLQNSTFDFQQNITIESYQEILLQDGRFFEVYSNVIDTQQTNYGSIFYFRDITNRKSFEQEIEKSYQFLLHILNTIPDPIFVKDEEHRWLLVNDAFCEFLGHSRAELIGKSDYDFFPPQEAEVFWEQDNLVFATGRAHANEEYLTDSDSVEHTIATHKAVFQNVNNSYILVGAIRDITQLKQTETKLKESEAFLKLIINTVPQAIFWKDIQSVYLGCNQTFAIAAGLEHPDLVMGKTDDDFPWSEAETKCCLEGDRYCIEQEKPLYHIAETQITPSGKQINVDISKVPLRNLKGEVIGVLGTYEDVSKQQRKVESLRLIVEGTASKIGQDFFQSCVKTLVNILDVNYALVTTFDKNNQAEIMALWEDGNLTSNSQFEFSQTFLIQLENTKEVIHYSLTEQDLLPRHDSLKSFIGANFLGIAIANASGDTLGYLAIADRQSLVDKLEEAKLILQIFAARASAELQRKYTQQALEHQLQRANLLAKITQQIRSNLRIEDVFQATVDSIGRAFAVSRCHLITCQEATVSSSQIVAEYCLADYISLLDASIPPGSNPYIEKVLTQDKAVASANIDREPLLRQQKQFSHQIELKSILAVRTSYQGKINGWLTLHQCDRYRQWKSEEIELLESVADSVGIALAQVQLLKQEITRRNQLNIQNQQLQAEITERQTIQQVLKEKSLAIESSYDGMAILEDYKFIYLNPTHIELFGYDSAEELLGQHWSVLYSHEELIHLETKIMPLLLKQGYWKGETLAKRKDGSLFDEEISLNFTSEGKVICICRNITERKQAERVLEQQLHRELLLSRITYEIRQRLDSQAIFHTATTQIGRAFRVNRCVIHTYETIPEPNICVVAEYLESESDYDSLLGLRITVKDNPHVTALLKRDIANATPNVYKDPLFEKIIPLCQQIKLKSVLAIRTSYQDEPNGCISLQQCDDYRQWTHEEITLLEAVATQVGIAISQAKLLEQEQKQRQELEIAKSKAEVASLAKSEFLAKMTHELRTPLNAILGFTQLMCRDSTTTSEQKEILSIINSSGEHLLSLISDVLEMSKIEAGKTTLQCLDCDLNRLLNSLFAMLQIKAKSKGIDLIFNLSPDLPPCIKIDEGKLRQILINLLSNAIKFTSQGTVTLTVNSQLMTPRTSSAGFTRGRGNLAPRPLALRGWGQPLTKANSLCEQALFFTLQDTGVGIAPEELKNLFQTFRQTKSGKNLGEGTGLGLAISQRFIQMMDGQISVESQVNRGTKFEFMIPLKMGNLQQVKYLEQQKDRQVVSLAAEQPDYKILIVEDQWENRRILHQLLNSIGFITKEAINGSQAINIAQSWQPDLILMDLELPILNGYQTTKKIKQHMTTKCPIIIAITANAFDEERQKMLSVGCDDFMAKPFQAENLFEVLAHHLKLQYIYEKSSDITHVSQPQHNEISPTAIKSQLTQMPPEWRDQMEECAIALERTIVLQLIAEIPDSARDLAITFKQWVEDFRFDKITECLKK
ncbi:putative Histidine kinase [Hyella patelloides LEGE 07179]|uniref:histidine kinase n=1 Tax=Hyella patelloides LEGE 07179 TaxID=945734 RepID=A0A563VPV9_9CYAN|nr:PAS domain S-box protein [Hyella patelloides]VEP13434.1 putative Histidine kinase [Hyella patelloides LEGE 07179]